MHLHVTAQTASSYHFISACAFAYARPDRRILDQAVLNKVRLGSFKIIYYWIGLLTVTHIAHICREIMKTCILCFRSHWLTFSWSCFDSCEVVNDVIKALVYTSYYVTK
jgi:hypothetical protein